MLIIAGLHVPLIPLVEVAGREGATLPEQTGPIALNAGIVAATIIVTQAGAVAILLQRSRTEPDALVRHIWKVALAVIAGLIVSVTVFV